MEEFNTIEEDTFFELTEKKSKFIANFVKVETVEEAEEMVKTLKKKYHDARHNCIAYRIAEEDKIVERFSDDGEPSGTAGGPMLNILQKNKLANVLIVVTRYFGGILLGTGGLVRAYSGALQGAIENATKVEKVLGELLEVEVTYSNFEIFKNYCKNRNIRIVKTEYLENIVCNIEVDKQNKIKLMKDFEDKNINLKELKELYVKYIDKCI